MYFRIALFLALIITSFEFFSQDNKTFRAYGSAGFNINQISGDSTAGFNYWGGKLGAGAYFMLSNKFSANLEINYSMRGASGDVFNELNQFKYNRAIQTNYIELPLILNYHDGNIARFGAGVAVSTLLNTKMWRNGKPITGEEVTGAYKPIDLSIVASVTFDIQKHFGANMRMMHSLIPANHRRSGEEDHYHITLSASALYYF
jgi:hypothetical protein